jgi:hypothetical protein
MVKYLALRMQQLSGCNLKGGFLERDVFMGLLSPSISPPGYYFNLDHGHIFSYTFHHTALLI